MVNYMSNHIYINHLQIESMFERFTPVSLLSSSLHVPYRITEFATYHNRVRYLYLDAKFKTCSREVVGAIT